MVTQLRAQLQSPARDPRPLAARLHAIVIAPARELLDLAGVHTLMLAPDGALRYVPFAALHDGERWLTEDYALAIYTPAERRRLLEAPSGEWRVAGFGVSEATGGFEALPTVREELDGIVREGSRDRRGVLPGEVHLDSAFDAATLSAALKRKPPVLHIASHFRFTPGTEADSFLLIGGGARLSLAEFRRGDFPLEAVDFLALSACETAVGASDADGREVEGFGALAQQKGARSVLATLWPVADQSTGLFMQTLYAEHDRTRGGKATALRATQLAFISGQTDGPRAGNAQRGARREGSGDTAGAPEWLPDPRAPFAHPFYWAPFILMGNWQ
jgi:CHAT domain-containing protein